MKPRLWKMYGVWWCGSYTTCQYGTGRLVDDDGECSVYPAEAYKLWKEKQ